MTSPHPIDVEKLLADQLATASPDLLRGLLSTFIHALMSAEADGLCGAGYGERSVSRSNRRNGYRHRDFDTRAGTIDVAIPKLRSGSYAFVAADALALKVRENGRVLGVHTLIATGVNAEGYREVLGVQVTSAEDGAGWLTFFRDLVARGLSGVALVTSDAHAGLVAAIGAHPARGGLAACRTHYAVNLMSVTPKSSRPWGRTLLHSVYDQPDAESVVAQYDRVVDALTDKLPKVAEHLDAARPDLLAFTAFPKQIWRQIWSNNPQNDSTKKSGGAPTSSASSSTVRPSSASSEPCLLNNTTNGSKAADTSASTSSIDPAPRSPRPPIAHTPAHRR
jgi:transposase-like protein